MKIRPFLSVFLSIFMAACATLVPTFEHSETKTPTTFPAGSATPTAPPINQHAAAYKHPYP